METYTDSLQSRDSACAAACPEVHAFQPEFTGTLRDVAFDMHHTFARLDSALVLPPPPYSLSFQI